MLLDNIFVKCRFAVDSQAFVETEFHEDGLPAQPYHSSPYLEFTDKYSIVQ
jgi:hypothetical protein